MPDFEEIGKAQIIAMIDSLEESAPGWVPMFYHTCTYEGDIAEADRLRKEFDLPRPDDRQREMDQILASYEEDVREYKAKIEVHERRKQSEWLYWITCKLGFRKSSQ